MMRSMVVAAGALFLGTFGACGGDDGQPPLMITEANAPAVAGEVLIGTGQVTASGGGLGGLSSAPTVVSLMRPQLTHLASGLRRLPGRPVSAAPETEDCAFGGTKTTTQTGDTSAKITYNQCEDSDGAVTNGTVSASVDIGGSSLSISASLDISITIGSVTIAESGDLTMTLGSDGGDLSSLDVSSDHLTVSVKNGNTVVDSLTMSNLTMHIGQTTSGGQTVATAHEKFDLDSSKLKGSFTVETSADVQSDSGSSYAFAGSLTITGASGSTLKITIQGDETSTPASGEGQIKLEVNGKVLWTDWADLAADASLAGSN